jgi:hypothetical protein
MCVTLAAPFIPVPPVIDWLYKAAPATPLNKERPMPLNLQQLFVEISKIPEAERANLPIALAAIDADDTFHDLGLASWAEPIDGYFYVGYNFEPINFYVGYNLDD